MIPLILVVVSTHITTVEITSNRATLSLEAHQTYTKARLPGYEVSSEAGAPEVPVKPVMVALPYGALVTDVQISIHSSEVLDGTYDLIHVREPFILSQEQLTDTKRTDEIYLSNAPYPDNIIEFKGTHYFDNHAICEFLFYPLQYFPLSQKIKFHSSVTVSISYTGGIQRNPRHDLIVSLVANPHDVAHSSRDRAAGFEYLIVTNPPMDTVMQRLADWKTKKGIKAEVRTIDWILAHYAGEDSAASVRTYLQTTVDSGVHYVLLAGDVDVVPHRRAYAMTCEWGGSSREDSLPCDLYYADLQGDWDRDNDGTYGEIEDSIDLYPDIMVGRAPVNTVAEAQKFVEKVLVYERNPALGYQDNAQLSADILWSSPYTDMAVHKESIIDESFPDYFVFNKLYQSIGNASPETFMDGLRAGQNLINHDGHGSTGSMTVGGSSSLHNEDFDTLTNAPLYGTLISIGCWTAAFDYNSIGESFVNSPQGGGVAYIGNSSYGWGAPGNPGFGYSDRYDSRFFYSLLQENNIHIGEALAMAKAHFIPHAREKNVYRWIQYQLNLLGDPEMCVWTEIPDSLEVTHPNSVPVGSSRILITVRDKATSQPIGNALVCIMKGDETYASVYTRTDGTALVDASPATEGTCELTVTAHNYLPAETVIPVVRGAYVNFMGWNIFDAFGNEDGIANPNEDIFLDVILKNTGDDSAHGIDLLLQTSDPLVTIYDSTAAIQTLNPGDSVWLNEAFEIVTGDAQNGYGISFNLQITYDDTLMHDPVILIGTPVMNSDEVVIIEQPSLPGEVESLYVNLTNAGYGIGHQTHVLMTSSDPNIAIIEDSVWYGEVDIESRAIAMQPFVIHIDEACPVPHAAVLPITIATDDYTFNDTVVVLVGETGFFDDMESGDALWTTGGADNLWHISTQNAYSPAHAWYSGDTTTMQYHDNMDCFIQTVRFLLHENSTLSFYRWFDVPIYGSDGIYVIVRGDGFSDTLDFIGTGGALATKGIQSDWFKEEYSLADYANGDSIQIRIAFTSDDDGDVGQGFFIDDVTIENQPAADPAAPYVMVRKVDDDLLLSWPPVTTDVLGNTEIVDHYTIYRDTVPDFVPQPADSIGSVHAPDTMFTDAGALHDEQSYYYLVKTVDVTHRQSTKSNMAYILCAHINENPGTTDKNWVSLPWHSEYMTVSDLTDDLSPYGDPLNKITNVQQRAQYESWLWDDLFMEWSGTNFAIMPGTAYEMNTVRDTVVVLTGSNNPDGYLQLYDNPDGPDHNLVSIPYNAVYEVVSDITSEYSPVGDPVIKITHLRNDQLFISWLWDDLFMEWTGTNFAIAPGTGYDFSVTNDTLWNPTESDNEPSRSTAVQTGPQDDIATSIGTETAPIRKPSWLIADGIWQMAEGIEQRARRREHGASNVERSTSRVERNASSHVVRCYIDNHDFDDIVFTAYRPARPYDVLTERMVGSGIARNTEHIALWCDVGNFHHPWHRNEEIIVIVEVLSDDMPHFGVVSVDLSEHDVQDIGCVTVHPLPEPNNKAGMLSWSQSDCDNVIGYSVFDRGRRLNSNIITACSYRTHACADVRVRPVVRGGYETVYCSGKQSQERKHTPLDYAFTIFPNPCHDRVTLTYALPRANNIDITIYDASGRNVKTVVSGYQEPGYYTTAWDGTDRMHRTAASGIYFVRCVADAFETTTKFLLVR